MADNAKAKPVPPDTLQFDQKVVVQDVWQWQVDYQLDESGVYEDTFEGPDGDPMQGQVKLCLSSKPGKEDGSKELLVSLLTTRNLVGVEEPCVRRQNYRVQDGWTDRDVLTITFSRHASKDDGVPWFLHNFVIVFSVSFASDPDRRHEFTVREELFTEMATMATAWSRPDDNYLNQCPRCGRSPLTIQEVYFGHVVSGEDLSSREVNATDLSVSLKELAEKVKGQKKAITDVQVQCQQCEWRSRLESIRLR